MITETLRQHLLETAAGLQWKQIGIQNHHGIVLPLFSLRSKTSCGIGEYPDLLPFIPWCKEIGLDVIQLLPLNDTGPESSPYSALSAFALNPIHLGLCQLPYLENDPTLKQQLIALQKLNTFQRINYPKVHKGRDEFLRAYYQKYGSKIQAGPDYITFKCQHSWLGDYAVFKALKVHFNWQNWEQWPKEFKNPSEELFQHLPSDLAKEAEYHIFLQYLCFQQFEQVKHSANKEDVYIKGDIPILINRESADVWRYRDLFLLEYAAGAPPDMYTPEGQKWGFPLYNWESMAVHGYEWWIKRLAIASQCYNIYRIDHIVGFFRIWGIPISGKAAEGKFIPEERGKWIPDGTIIMHIMLRHSDMLPIGEDLGTVPPEVRDCLRALGICSTKVMRWERRWNEDRGFISPNDYQPESMTTVSTHDSETLAQWWKNQTEEARTYAETLGWDYSPELSQKQRLAILRASHHSSSIFHINLLQEYLALIPDMTWPEAEDERINIPGTITERNWSYRFRPSVEEIVGNSVLKQAIKELTG